MKKVFWMVLLLVGLTSHAQQDNGKPLKIYVADGTSVRSYHFAGFENYLHRSSDTTYVINFWATWCAPCIKELPHFEKLHSEYKNKKVKVILVSMDMPKQAESKLIPFIQRKKLKSEVLLLDDPDANAWIEKVDPSWSGAIPATVIYNNKLRKFYEQSFTYEELESEINQFIK